MYYLKLTLGIVWSDLRIPSHLHIPERLTLLQNEAYENKKTHSYVPVKLKLQHPSPPRAYPGYLTVDRGREGGI